MLLKILLSMIRYIKYCTHLYFCCCADPYKLNVIWLQSLCVCIWRSGGGHLYAKYRVWKVLWWPLQWNFIINLFYLKIPYSNSEKKSEFPFPFRFFLTNKIRKLILFNTPVLNIKGWSEGKKIDHSLVNNKCSFFLDKLKGVVPRYWTTWTHQ